MKYSEHYSIRWHDTDAGRTARPSAILMYMQETANLHCKNHGRPLDRMRDEEGLAFLLSRLSMRLYQPLYAYETIEVQTWISESRGFRFPRHFRILREGEVVAEALSVWALLDLKTRGFVRAEHFDYGFSPDPAPEPELPTRIHASKEAVWEKVGERRIAYSDIDYNGHMNNTRYPDMLCDFLDDIDTLRVREIVISYLSEAPLGDTPEIFRIKEGDTYYFRTRTGAGTIGIEASVETEPKG